MKTAIAPVAAERRNRIILDFSNFGSSCGRSKGRNKIKNNIMKTNLSIGI
jgi:hypothetical protein